MVVTYLVIDRAGVFFDTSPLPSDAIIDSAKLTFYIGEDDSSQDFDIVVQNGQPTYPHDPMEVGDYNKANYSDDGGSINTLNITSPFDIVLNATGISWINKDGTTKLCLRSSRDIAGTAPTYGVPEYIQLTDADQGPATAPTLTIEYHRPTTLLKGSLRIVGSTKIT